MVMKALPAETDFIVVGAGIAGLRAAVELASAGRVLCLAKREVTESNTQYAQGGIAAALSDEDEVRAAPGRHAESRRRAVQRGGGAGAGGGRATSASRSSSSGARSLTARARKIAFTREGAHSRSRVLHAHGDSTGREIGRALYLKATDAEAHLLPRI